MLDYSTHPILKLQCFGPNQVATFLGLGMFIFFFWGLF
jgi:hypothetical protein